MALGSEPLPLYDGATQALLNLANERGEESIVQVNYQTVDTAVFLIANLVNILIIGIMLSRPFGLKHLERRLGLVAVACALPTGLAALLNALGRREWWTVVLPSLLVTHLILELVLDYILTFDFRNTRLLGPYLLVFYVSMMGMIGYAFLVSEMYGAVTLATYLLGLLATWYSYSRVGHGQREKDRSPNRPCTTGQDVVH